MSVLLLELVVPLVEVDVEDQQTSGAKSCQQEPVTGRYRNKIEKIGINQRHIHTHKYMVTVLKCKHYLGKGKKHDGARLSEPSFILDLSSTAIINLLILQHSFTIDPLNQLFSW